MDYLLFHGFSRELSFLEASTLLGSKVRKHNSFFTVSCSLDKITKFSQINGGLTHISQVILNTSEPLKDIEILIKDMDSKNFAITNYTTLDISPSFLPSLKKITKKPIRYLTTDTKKADLVPIKKKHATHFIITENGNDFTISKTIWIHDFNEFNKRDRYKPFRNAKKGMMPPKLARMMINIATEGSTLALLDPFCGTGTILMEGMLLGNEVYGTDIDANSVNGAKKNLDWLIEQYGVRSKYEILTHDATKASEIFKDIDLIITEPFMGKLLSPGYFTSNSFSRTEIKNILKGLDNLYKGALKDWQKVLSSNGKIFMIFPEIHAMGSVYRTTSIDTCENLGYNIIAKLKYSKPDSHLVRNLVLLEKNVKD